MISFVVPTIGRPSLRATLASLELWPGDELLIVGDENALAYASSIDTPKGSVRHVRCERGNDWGHRERNFASPLARNRYIAHIDDDDVYTPGARSFMSDAIHNTPDRPVIFKMRYPNGMELWQSQVFRCGNIGTPMFLLPNDKTKMIGRWMPYVGGDFAFLEGCKWVFEDYVWRPEVVALLGHNT